MATNSTVVSLLSKEEKKFDVNIELLKLYTDVAPDVFKRIKAADFEDILEYINHHGAKETRIDVLHIDEKTTLASRLDEWDCKWIAGIVTKDPEYSSLFDALELLGMDNCINKLSLNKAIMWIKGGKIQPELLAKKYAEKVVAG